MAVPDAGHAERLGHNIRVELRVGARPRHGPYIDEQIDPGLAQQRDQLLGRARRMAYREDGHLSLRAKRSNPLPIWLSPMGIASSLRSSQWRAALIHVLAAIDRQRRAGDEIGVVGDQEQHG